MMRKLSFAFLFLLSLSPAFGQVPAPVPALPDTERRTSYSITGTTCACNVNFALFGDGTDYANWVEVFINGVRYDYNDASHGWTITSPSGSLGTLARPITNAVLTFNAVQTGTVQIVGARRPRRTAQFSENAGVSARNLNQVFTDIISQNREIWDKTNDVTGRSLLGLPGESIFTMPAAATRAGKFLYFDVTGLIPQFTTGGAGTGNVVGPVSSTSGDIALWDNATGTLLRDGGGGAPSIAVIHPSSGNLVGAGCSTAHQLWWVDQNFCSKADSIVFTSSDPSAINFITVTGVPATGTLTVTLKFNATTYAIPVAVTTGQTTTQVAAAIVTAVKAFSTAVYNNVAGAQGEVLYITNTANVVAYDSNSTVSTTIAYAPGATALTLTFQAGQATAATDYALATQWDNNPALVLARNPGTAPPTNSVLGVIQFSGSQSSSPGTLTVQYGSISTQVLNSTTGALSSRINLITPDINNVQNQGLYIGNGVYTVGTTDKGVDTVDAKQFWVNGTEKIFLNGVDFELLSSGANNILLAPGSGAVSVAKAGSGVSFTVQGDTAQLQAFIWQDGGGIRWEAYKPASTTDLRFFDNTADRVIFKNGGIVQITTGGLTVGDSGSPASGIISAATGYRIGNAAPTSGHYLRSNGTNFIDGVIDAGDVSTGLLAVARGGTGLGSGTSGGVLGYTAAGTLASSVALASNTLVAGGGAGATPKNSGLTVAGSDLTSLNASSTVSSLPQFVLTNNVADANSASFLFKKNRAAADTSSSDQFLDMQAYGWASSAQQISARWQMVQAAASSGANIPSKQVWNTSNAAGQLNQTLTFDNNAHISVGQATAPTVTAGCNGAGSSITGNDTYGTVTGQTAAATTCTVTFGTAYAATPHCNATGLSSPLTGVVTPSTTTLVVNFGSTANYKFTYECKGA